MKNKFKKYARGGTVNLDPTNNKDSKRKRRSSIFGDDFLGFNNVGNKIKLESEEELKNENLPVQFSGEDLENFLSARESGGNYQAQSKNSSAVGKYQFLWSYHGDNIRKLTGVKTKEEFLKSPEAQETYYNYYKEKELKPALQRFGEALRRDLGNISDEQIMAAYHFAGPGNLSKAIKNKSYDVPLDANGTSILSYISPRKSDKVKKKYDKGGLVNVARGISSIAPTLLSLLDEASKGYATQPIVAQQQVNSYNPLSRSFQLPQFKSGGIVLSDMVPIEAEGQEMLETPEGLVGEIQGPTHEQGGVAMVVPDGTKIYSDRISIDGKTMSERKEARTKILRKLEKLLEKSPKDRLLKSTYLRTKESMDMLDAKDMQIQEVANMSPSNKFASGGVARTPINPLIGEGALLPGLQIGYSSLPDYSPAQNLPETDFNLGEPITVNEFGIGSTPLSFEPNTNSNISSYDENFTAPPSINSYPQTSFNNLPSYSPVSSVPIGGDESDDTIEYGSASRLGLGDIVGLVGNAVSGIGPMINTISNRQGDTPNVNYFKNFGRRALDTNREAQDYVAGMRENALSRILQRSNAAKASNRNNASSINTIRALDIATNLGTDTSINDIYDKAAAQMVQLLGQRSQLENMQDQVVMTGEAQRDLADRQDRDNFYTQMAENLTNLGVNMQGLGKNLNVNRSNSDIVSLMKQMSRYGLTWTRDSNGNLVLTKI